MGKYPLPPGPFGSLYSKVVFKCKQIYLQFWPGLDLGKLPKGIMARQGLPVKVLPPPQLAYDWHRFKGGLRYKGCLFVRIPLKVLDFSKLVLIYINIGFIS